MPACIVILRQLTSDDLSDKEDPSNHALMLYYILCFTYYSMFCRYLRECEFGRIDFWISNGMFEVMEKNNTAVTVTATCARYRRSLHLYQKIVLQTRVLAWDEDAFYLEQRFVGKNGFVHALVLSKNKTVSRDISGRLFTPEELVSLLYGECKESPRKSEDLELWIKYNSVSCERLKTISLPTDAQN